MIRDELCVYELQGQSYYIIKDDTLKFDRNFHGKY